MGDVHYCTSSEEFGEYELDEMDTFNFKVIYCKVGGICYTLENPTPELKCYLDLQSKNFSTGWIKNIEPSDYEKYCMEKGNAPFVLTKEIRACLQSKLWAFYEPKKNDTTEHLGIRNTISEDITISFKNEYQLLPHVSFYMTPVKLPVNVGWQFSIKEITTKYVTFNILNYSPKEQFPSGLKLHFRVNGAVKQTRAADEPS